MKRLMLLAGTLLVAGSLAVGYNVGRARAFGVPTATSGTLSYTGSLLTFGQPDNSTHNISVALWVSGASSSACNSSTFSITVANGQFTVPLPASCATVIHQNPNVQAEVTVDTVALGFTSLAAVPYALEASASPGAQMLSNLGLTATVASNVLSINLVQDDGQSTPTAQNPVIIGFRSVTATQGGLIPIQVTSALPLALPAGASLGQVSGVAEHTFVYAQDNGGSVQLCVSTTGYFDEGSLQASLAVSTTSTSRTTMYCTAAATGPVRLVGRILSTQATAGAWATAPVEVAIPPFVGGRVSSTGTAQQHVETVLFNGAGSNGGSFALRRPVEHGRACLRSLRSARAATATPALRIQ